MNEDLRHIATTHHIFHCAMGPDKPRSIAISARVGTIELAGWLGWMLENETISILKTGEAGSLPYGISPSPL
jgi:hypothetical protein